MKERNSRNERGFSEQRFQLPKGMKGFCWESQKRKERGKINVGVDHLVSFFIHIITDNFLIGNFLTELPAIVVFALYYCR